MNTDNIEVGSFVEDMSGCIGEVISIHTYGFLAEVKFAPNCFRTLQMEKLKLAKYCPIKLQKVRAAAPDLLEALQKLSSLFDYNNQAIYSFAKKEIDEANLAIKKATI